MIANILNYLFASELELVCHRILLFAFSPSFFWTALWLLNWLNDFFCFNCNDNFFQLLYNWLVGFMLYLSAVGFCAWFVWFSIGTCSFHLFPQYMFHFCFVGSHKRTDFRNRMCIIFVSKPFYESARILAYWSLVIGVDMMVIAHRSTSWMISVWS